MGKSSVLFRQTRNWDRKDAPVNSDYTTTGTDAKHSDLIRQAQQGDSEAFAALFHAHKTRIYSVCLRMTNNTAEAEDLTQEAFLQVFRKIETFRGASAFSTWLHRLAVNTVLMRLRKKSLRQVALDEPYGGADGATMHREYGAKDDRLTGCLDRLALASAISALPHGCRTMFLLHEVEGYEHQEIADMLGCSVGNSKSQLHKAKRRIRELLAHSAGARSRASRIEASSNKHSNPLIDMRPSPISQDVVMRKVSNVSQLIARNA
jgi:RNA polymerase sigma-70 factor, ECF subfamily